MPDAQGAVGKERQVGKHSTVIGSNLADPAQTRLHLFHDGLGVFPVVGIVAAGPDLFTLQEVEYPQAVSVAR